MQQKKKTKKNEWKLKGWSWIKMIRKKWDWRNDIKKNETQTNKKCNKNE